MSADQLSPLIADLHLLSVLADTRSFTEAARRLGVSKASASMRVSELERTAGVLLVRRTTRSVGLTDAGQQLVADLQPAFSRISDSYSAVRDMVGAPRGLVRVTAPVALGRQHLAPMIAGFLKHYPDIHIELELTDRFINLSNEGFDLGNSSPKIAAGRLVIGCRCSRFGRIGQRLQISEGAANHSTVTDFARLRG